MALTLEIVSRHGRMLGKERIRTFGIKGGTIGRSLETDWHLPDEQRFLSNRHATIDFHGGAYYLVDTSKNGVYINDSDKPVGLGRPQRLFSGDRIRMGDYEMTVAIENFEDLHETLLSTSHVDPVDAAQRVEGPDPMSFDLVDASAITGIGIEMLLEEEDLEKLRPADESSEPPAAAQSSQALATPLRSTRSTSARLRAVESGEPSQLPMKEDPIEAFFRGAGVDVPKLTDTESVRLMEQAGRVMRELITGAIDCLHLRALQKAQLKQSNTVIEPRENNRLKFSANFDEGFSRLFLDDTDEFMGADESVRSTFADIKAHQRSLLNAMRAALSEYLERLDPQEIESKASNGRRNGLINAANKLKYWDLYKDVYAILANHAGDELPQPFLDALAKAERESAAHDAATGSTSITKKTG